MKTSYTDYSYALDLLKRFNSLIESDNSLQKFFLHDNLNLLQAYQGALFSDMKTWSEVKGSPEPGVRRLPSLFLKAALSGVFCISVTLLTALYSILARKRILVFSGDKIDGVHKNDFRLDPLYEALSSRGAEYIEILHTLGGKTMLKHLYERARPVMYIESIDLFLFPVIWYKKQRSRRIVRGVDLHAFEPFERSYVSSLLEKYISATYITRGRLSILAAFFVVSRIECIVSIDDTRHYSEIMAAAGRSGLQTYAVQHGHFTKYHVGWLKETGLPGALLKPAHLVVWSEYWKRELMRLSSIFGEDEIIVGGERNSFEWIKRTRSNKFVILIPYEKDGPKQEIKSYILRFLEIPGTEVIFKIRADLDKQEQLDDYGLKSEIHKITVVRNIRDVIGRVSITVGTYSTFLYDMVAHGCPVAILKTSIDYGEGMVHNGLADQLGLDRDIQERLRFIADLSDGELECRREKLIGAGSLDLRNTLEDIIKRYV